MAPCPRPRPASASAAAAAATPAVLRVGSASASAAAVPAELSAGSAPLWAAAAAAALLGVASASEPPRFVGPASQTTSMLLPSALPCDPSGPGDVVMPVAVQGAPNALAAASRCGLQQLVTVAPLAPLQTSTTPPATPPTAAALAADALALRRSDPAISGQTAGARPDRGRGLRKHKTVTSLTLQATTPAPLATVSTGQLPPSPASTPTPLTGPGQVDPPLTAALTKENAALRTSPPSPLESIDHAGLSCNIQVAPPVRPG